ncbi:MAG: hypothetical protein ABFR75_09180 [Acidobacteriota bacterium]
MDPNSDAIMGMIVMPIMFALIAYVVKLIMDNKKNRLKSELNNKLVDKFGDVKELNEFLQSDSGNKFLRSMSIEYVKPKERIMSSISKGLIFGFLGLSFLPVGMIFSADSKYYFAVGIVLFALGLSFLVSSAVSYKLSIKWGIIKDDE